MHDAVREYVVEHPHDDDAIPVVEWTAHVSGRSAERRPVPGEVERGQHRDVGVVHVSHNIACIALM